MEIIEIGITGSREGFTTVQLQKFTEIVDEIIEDNKNVYLHQGQCIGVDITAGQLLADKGVRIISHPPKNKNLVGECTVHYTRPEKDYFARNRDIVDESDFMIVVPNTMQHRSYGGTWYTHDYADMKGKPLCIIYPDGRVEYKGLNDD